MKHLYLLFFSIFFLLQITYADGIQLNLNGHRQLGMAQTGTGLALDAATIFINPAGLSFVDKRETLFGASIVMPRTMISSRRPIPYTERMGPNLLYTPFYFYTSWRKKGSRFSWGVGLNNPFRYETKWPDDWEGRFITQEAALTTLFIQASTSFKVNSKLSIGGGLVYGLGNTYSRKALPINVPGSNDAEGSMELSGKGDGWGANIGIYFQPNDSFSIGMSYRLGFDVDILAGEAKFEVPQSLGDLYPQTTFQSQLSFPHIWNIGWAYRPRDRLTLAFDINYAQWKEIDTVIVNFVDNTSELQDTKLAKNYKNTFAFRIGGEYIFNELVRLRGGIFYETTPIQDNYVSPELPDANRIGLSAGATVYFIKSLSVDIGYQYLFTGERTAILRSANFGGSYQSVFSVVGLGVRYAY